MWAHRLEAEYKILSDGRIRIESWFETGDSPDNTILEEFQRGYNFRGRLLRPAMVKVAVKKQ